MSTTPALVMGYDTQFTFTSGKGAIYENSVATQKQYSTRINTNKIQNTTIKSITSSFFTKLNYL